MPRIARVEALGVGHHVIQRGNRSQRVFFSEGDKREYLKILKLQTDLFKVDIWAYCLMDNHVHLIVVPWEKGSLTKAIGETNRLYTRMINFRNKWRGYLWQGRFSSFPLDSNYLYYCVRYVERNPVRSRLVKRAEDYDFSSARAHIMKRDDLLLKPFYLCQEIKDWKKYLEEIDDQERIDIIHKHILTGRPLGAQEFIEELEAESSRTLKRRKTGPDKIGLRYVSPEKNL